MDSNPKVTLNYTLNEINEIIRILGEIPAKYNTTGLIQNIKAQAEPQVKALNDSTSQ